MLGIGAWNQVNVDTSGIYGNSFSTLLPLEDNSFSDNQVFFSIRKDWLYETGVDYNAPSYKVVSTVYDEDSGTTEVSLNSNHNFSDSDIVRYRHNTIDNIYNVQNQEQNIVFINETGQLPDAGTLNGVYNPVLPSIYVNDVLQNSGFNIDYNNGKVVFDTPLASSAEVRADYSYRSVQSYLGSQTSWQFEIQKDSFNPANTSWLEGAQSGEFSVDPSQRVQLPAVIIEGLSRAPGTPYALGTSTLINNPIIIFTVVSQNKYERDLIIDILTNQQGTSMSLYDTDLVSKDQKLPLTFEGYKNNSGLMYDDLASDPQYFWAKAYIKSANSSEVITKSPELFMGKVRYEIEVIR